MKSTSYLIYFLYYREVSLAANNADGGDTAGDTAGASDLQLKLFWIVISCCDCFSHNW